MPPKPSGSEISRARELQKKGKKAKGIPSVDLLIEAAEAYLLAALSTSIANEDKEEAVFEAALTFQEAADRLLATYVEMADESQSAAKHISISLDAAALYRRAIEIYGQINDEASLVNMSAVLVSLAEVESEQEKALAYYDEAIQSIKRAIEMEEEEDPEKKTNLADILISRLKLASDMSLPGGIDPLSLKEALDMYEITLGMMDSRQGDDIGGLLLNWSSALLAGAEILQDHNDKMACLEQAVTKTRDALQFTRGMFEPYIIIGDAMVQAGEELSKIQDRWPNALQTLQDAVEEYKKALTVNNGSSEAHIGMSEAYIALAKLCSKVNAEPERTSQYYSAGLDSYAKALRYPEKLGSFHDRATIRYNVSCALILSGQEDEGRALLTQLLQSGGVTRETIQSDDDFLSVRKKEWFSRLIDPLLQMTS